METGIVMVIVALAAGYLLWTARKRSRKGGGGCGCTSRCSACPPSANCDEKVNGQSSK